MRFLDELAEFQQDVLDSLPQSIETDDALHDRTDAPDESARRLLADAGGKMQLSARGHHRVLRVARAIADLAGADNIRQSYVAEALSYRQRPPVN